MGTVLYINIDNKSVLIDKNRPNSKMATAFEEAVENINKKINKTLSNDELLDLYALYKQAIVGDCNIAQPGMTELKAKAKWDAWNGKKGLSQDDAKSQYVELANKMIEKHGTA